MTADKRKAAERGYLKGITWLVLMDFTAGIV